jgi:hypothetical protein
MVLPETAALANLLRAKSIDFYSDHSRTIATQGKIPEFSQIQSWQSSPQPLPTLALPHSSDECHYDLIHTCVSVIRFQGGIGGSKTIRELVDDVCAEARIPSKKFGQLSILDFKGETTAWNAAHFQKARPTGFEFASLFEILKDITKGKSHPFCHIINRLALDTSKFVRQFESSAETVKSSSRDFKMGTWYEGAFYKVLYYELGQPSVGTIPLKIFFDTEVVPLPGGKKVNKAWEEQFGFAYNKYEKNISWIMQRHFAKLAGCTAIDINSGLWWIT